MNLDCETMELAEESLAKILHLPQWQLHERILAIKRADFPVDTDTATDRWLPMLHHVAGRVVTDSVAGKTYWFHATRVKDFLAFRDGIHPLPRNLNRIWTSLYSMVSDRLSPQEWDEFRRQTERNNYGGHAKEVITAWMSNEGPYAFLFSDSALDPKALGNHDYLATSELIEFIAICFKREHGVDLHAIHHAETRPGLVKFTTPGVKAVHMGATLSYLQHRFAGWSLCCLDPCFSGQGKQVLPAQIEKVIPMLENSGHYGNRNIYNLSPQSAHVPLQS